MRELASTGFMSNRGRQNVASLLCKVWQAVAYSTYRCVPQDLQEDWRLGAALFESLLLDCDVAVNYCNWNYFAGVGNDPRNRKFKTVSQGETYDAEGLLAERWVPELAGLPAALRHRPWLEGGVPGYPEPLVDPAGHIKAG